MRWSGGGEEVMRWSGGGDEVEWRGGGDEVLCGVPSLQG